MDLRLVIAVCVVWPSVARASESRAVSLDEALSIASSLPVVEATREAARRRSDFDASRAGSVGLPQLTVQPGFRAFSESDRGPELQVGYLHPLSTADVGGARRTAAVGESKVLEAEASVLRFERRARVIDAWVEAWSAEGVAAEVEAEWSEAAALRARVDAAVTAGALLAVERAEARAYEAEARLEFLHAEGIRFEAWLGLGRALGEATGVPVRTKGTPPPAIGLQAFSSPEQARIDAELEAVAARRSVRLAEQAPQLGVGGMLQRESPSHWIGFLTATLTLPVTTQGVSEQASEDSARARLEGERRDAESELAFRRAHARHEVGHKREELATARGEWLPALVEAVALRDAALGRGAGGVLELSTARRRALAGKARVRLLEGEVARAVLHLAELGEAAEGPSQAPGGP